MMSFRRPAVVAAGVLLVLFAGLSAGPRPSTPASAPAAVEDGISVYFSPNGGCIEAIVGAVRSAKSTIDVQAYLMSTKQIAGPLVDAQRRGVAVRVIFDAGNLRDGGGNSMAGFLANGGVTVLTDAEHKEAHNKVMIVDGKTVVTGSFNFTRAADEENAENLLVLHDKPKVAAAYARNFEAHLKHAKPFSP